MDFTSLFLRLQVCTIMVPIFFTRATNLTFICYCFRLILTLMDLPPSSWILLFKLLLMEVCSCVPQRIWQCYVVVMGRFAIQSKHSYLYAYLLWLNINSAPWTYQSNIVRGIRYGSYPLKGKYCHEMALRILLACIEVLLCFLLYLFPWICKLSNFFLIVLPEV